MDGVKGTVVKTLLLATLAAAATARTQRWCPAFYSRVGGRCLHFATYAAMSHSDAMELCKSVNGVLASVLTATQHKEIVDFMNNQGLNDGDYWLDGTDKAVEGKWVTSTGALLPLGTPLWFAKVGLQQPDNYGRGEDCLALNNGNGYYLNDVSCNSQYRAICEASNARAGHTRPAAARVVCPQLYTAVGSLCLAFHTYMDQTWQQARDTCRGLGGELAAITDIEDLRAIYLHLHNRSISGHDYWIGGTDEGHEGTWTWTTGGDVPKGTPFWGTWATKKAPDGGTNENCLSLMSKPKHFFQDVSCAYTLKPLCMAN